MLRAQPKPDKTAGQAGKLPPAILPGKLIPNHRCGDSRSTGLPWFQGRGARINAGPARSQMPSAKVSRLKLFPPALGFREGAASIHTSRTMMLDELRLVLDTVKPESASPCYMAAIIEENALGKPTQSTRQRSAKRLAELYALDPAVALFRVFRQFWEADKAARPILAFLAAAARDPLLREITPFLASIPPGTNVNANQVAQYLAEKHPGRFKPTTLKSTAQNIASSWTQAGLLTGKVNKKRARPIVTPVALAFSLALGYLCGMRGRMLLDTVWTRMLDRTPAEIADLATDASKQGWMNYKAAGSVVEISFPGLLTPQEEKASYEPD
jgi:hypothetical protein